MPKYIKKRPGPKPKPHKVINNIKHKQCRGMCKKWKPLDQFRKKRNGKHSYCKACDNRKNKQRHKVIKEKYNKAREMAPTGFLVCLSVFCKVKGLQPVNQFIHPHVRNDEPTSNCLNCRNKGNEARIRREAECQKVWDDWRKTHPCVKCINNPNYEHNYLLIEADHLPEFKKIKICSDMSYWSAKCRGPAAQKAELKKCQALCKFHHRLVTQQRRHDKGEIKKQCRIRRRGIINAEKHKRGCCKLCKRVLKEGEECAFDFDHRDPSTKFKYKYIKGPGQFVDLPDALFATQWPIEKELVDLLCANCHTLKSKRNKDGYRK